MNFNSNMKKYLVHFISFTAVSWFLASSVYLLLAQIMPSGVVFGSWFRMPAYHWQHPYQYILVVAVAYGLTATIWGRFLGHLRGWKRAVSIGLVMVISLLVASIPGGILWGIHDIQAGFVPQYPVMLRNLMWAGTAGLTAGWLIIGLSIPYNILCCIGGYFLTHFGQRFLEKGVGVHHP